MKPLNTVLVSVEKEFDDVSKTIVGPDGKAVPIYKDFTYNQGFKKNICGTVVEPPLKMGKEALYYVYPGAPEPTRYWGHEKTQTLLNSLTPEIRELKGPEYIARYNPAAHEWYEWVDCNDQENILQPGDKVYFHFNSVKLSMWMYHDPATGSQVYRIPYHNLICAVRDGEILMMNGYSLVKPFIGDFSDYEEYMVGNVKYMTKVLDSGILAAAEAKPKYLHGKLIKKGNVVGDSPRSNITDGDIIIFTKLSEFENNIEGEDYYTIRVWDLVAKIENDQVHPTDDWVLIEPRKWEDDERRQWYHQETYDGANGKILLNDYDVPFRPQGYVKALGDSCPRNEIGLGDEVLFLGAGTEKRKGGSAHFIPLETGQVLIPYGDILATVQSNHQIYLKKWKI